MLQLFLGSSLRCIWQIFAVENGNKHSMWKQIGGQPSILSPEHYGHVDWSMYMLLLFVKQFSYHSFPLFVLWLIFFSLPFKNFLGLLFKDILGRNDWFYFQILFFQIWWYCCWLLGSRGGHSKVFFFIA